MIEINNLSKTYNYGKENEFKALDNISLTVKKGEMVAIVGKSGAGKSTLLHILGCIDNYETGEYRLNGNLIKNLSDKKAAKLRNEKIGIVMQDYALVEDFTALENVMIPLDFSNKKVKKKMLAIEQLDSVNMRELANKKVKNMSGGQKQRVAIARAMVNQPVILLADEPTGALDEKTSMEIMDLFMNLKTKNGATIIIVTHDREIAEKCERIIELADGRVV